MGYSDKAVLEPRVSPAFTITYFCNHCNIRFENTSKYVDILTLFSKTWTKGHWPLDDLWPHICWGHMCDSTQRSLCRLSHGNASMYVDTVINFAKWPHTTTYYVQNEWSHSLLLNSVQARQKWLLRKFETWTNSHNELGLQQNIWTQWPLIDAEELLYVARSNFQHCCSW